MNIVRAGDKIYKADPIKVVRKRINLKTGEKTEYELSKEETEEWLKKHNMKKEIPEK